MKRPQAFLKNLKMRTQFLYLLTSLVCFILSLLIAVIYCSSILLQKYLCEASNQIYLKETTSSNNYNTANYETHLQHLFEISENQLIALSQIYLKALQFVPEMNPIIIHQEMNLNLTGIEMIPQSLRYPENWGKTPITYGSQCYSNTSVFDTPLSRIQEIGVKIQEYYTSVGFVIYQGEEANQGLYYGYWERDGILSDYPCVSFGEDIYNYVVPKRDWYKTAIQTYNISSKTKYVSAFTPPYLQYTKKEIGIALVVPIIDENQEFLGGWGTGIILPTVLKQFILTDEKIETFFLTDEKGVLLMHPFNVTFEQLPVYFHNEQITGFDSDDWNQIISPNPVSNCKGYLQLSQLLCRRNKRFNKQLLIRVSIIKKYHMYLIMIIDNMEQTKFQHQFENRIDTKINSIILVNSFQIVIVFIFLLFLTFLVTYYLFKPIDWITECCRNRIDNLGSQKTEIKYLSQFQINLMSFEIKQLYYVFMYFFDQLKSLSMKKSPQCKIIQSFYYPQFYKTRPYRKLLKELKLIKNKNQLSNIENYY